MAENDVFLQQLQERGQVEAGNEERRGQQWLGFQRIFAWWTVFALLVQFVQTSLPALVPDTWNMLTSSESELFHPMWGPLLVSEIIYNVLFLAYTIYVMINFYKKKAILPRLMIIFYSASLVVGIIDTVMVYQIETARDADDGSLLSETFRSFVICLIWIPYFLVSKRVRNTFIR